MSTRNIEFILKPTSVALVGVSAKPGSVGAVLVKNLLGAGFRGEVFPVNPRYETLEGMKVYPSVASLPKAPDLALIATPPETVPGVVADAGERGVKAAVIITSGLGEGGLKRGVELRSEILEAARPHLMRIVGPNCLGVMSPGVRLNASLAHISPLPGRLAFISQSGALQTAILDWATSLEIGFSHVIGLGGMADVDIGDMLDYLATDLSTRAVLLYLEGLTNARKFMSAARAAARMKPVIVVKGGRHEEAGRAAETHTGIAAGVDGVYDAAFGRAGMLRVQDIRSLFSAVETLATMPRPVKGDRIIILTNGGGVGVLATDSLMDEGARLAELTPETMAKLNAVLPAIWSHGNPVDIRSDAPPGRYADALEIILDEGGADGILILNSPYAVSSGVEAARQVVETLKKRSGRMNVPMALTCWLGGACTEEARRLFAQNRIPTYEAPLDAIRAFMQMHRYQRNQEMLMETPPSIPESFTPDVRRARRAVDKALAQGREWLTEAEAEAVLDAYAIPAGATRVAASKSRAAGARAEAGDAREYWRSRDRRTKGYEFSIEMFDDPQFGPVIRFGCWGANSAPCRDRAHALPPLNMSLARRLIARTPIARMFEDGGSALEVDLESVALALVKVSQLVSDIDEIMELSIHPLLAMQQGVAAMRTRIRVAGSDSRASQRMAIRPYPKELETTIATSDSRIFQIRPIRPEDEPEFQRLFAGLSPDEIRMRFLHPMQTLTHSQAARLTQIDYDREMALVLADPEGGAEQEIFGNVQIIADPDGLKAEFAVLVRRDMAGKGLGRILMRRIIAYARSRGMQEIFGEVLTENKPMLKLAERLGFTSSHDPENPGSVIVSLKL